jgi:hypothetical protein
MSFIAIASVALLAAPPAFGQAPAPAAHPYGLDPYAPSDAVWLRNFGASLVAQTPLVDLAATLNPYNPSDAALLRQFGGAIPLCCPEWYWQGPTFGPLTPLFPHGRVGSSAVRFPDVRGLDFRTAASASADASARTDVAAPATQLTPSSIVTLARPQDNNGVSIRYEGEIWTSAGRAVPLPGTGFERVGEVGTFAVYKRAGVNDDLIYVQTRNNLIAPFRRR